MNQKETENWLFEDTGPSGGLALLAVCAVLLALPGAVLAQDPPLTSGNYRLDLHPGPVLGNTRVIGLGGAFGAIAEGAVGIAHNPASVGNRPRHERDRFYWDTGFDYIAPGRLQGSEFDFDNNDKALSTRMVAMDLGLLLQYENFGGGIGAQLSNYQFDDGKEPARKFIANLGTVHVPLGLALFSHALVLGGGARLGFLNIREVGGPTGLDAETLGLELGILLRPTFLPFRLSMALHSPLWSWSQVREDPSSPTPIFLPGNGVAVPFEFSAGLSVFLSGRKYNKVPDFENPPELKEEFRWFQKMSVLLSVGVVVTGNTRDAIGIDGFLEQVYERSGANVGVSPRLGLEAEVWPGRLRIRHGTYWEPGRTEHYAGRLHATFSADLRLFRFRLFGEHELMVCFASDFAHRYVNLSLSLGFWNGT